MKTKEDVIPAEKIFSFNEVMDILGKGKPMDSKEVQTLKHVNDRIKEHVKQWFEESKTSPFSFTESIAEASGKRLRLVKQGELKENGEAYLELSRLFATASVAKNFMDVVPVPLMEGDKKDRYGAESSGVSGTAVVESPGNRDKGPLSSGMGGKSSTALDIVQEDGSISAETGGTLFDQNTSISDLGAIYNDKASKERKKGAGEVVSKSLDDPSRKQVWDESLKGTGYTADDLKAAAEKAAKTGDTGDLKRILDASKAGSKIYSALSYASKSGYYEISGKSLIIFSAKGVFDFTIKEFDQNYIDMCIKVAGSSGYAIANKFSSKDGALVVNSEKVPLAGASVEADMAFSFRFWDEQRIDLKVSGSVDYKKIYLEQLGGDYTIGAGLGMVWRFDRTAAGTVQGIYMDTFYNTGSKFVEESFGGTAGYRVDSLSLASLIVDAFIGAGYMFEPNTKTHFALFEAGVNFDFRRMTSSEYAPEMWAKGAVVYDPKAGDFDYSASGGFMVPVYKGKGTVKGIGVGAEGIYGPQGKGASFIFKMEF